VAHAYNPSYSGGSDQEDHASKPAGANSSIRPYLGKTLHKNAEKRKKLPTQNRAGAVAQVAEHLPHKHRP
jgi:hypothetical protein